ncbi:MAG: DUF938 domain-containing protein [Gammaproteobacteria bacterium]
MDKPFSQACENNKKFILEVLERIFSDPCIMIEVGSGTGQHAIYFAEKLPHITWQPTDQAENLNGIEQWITETDLSNISPPVKLNVRDDPWPFLEIEACFTANTLHIMSWPEVEILFSHLGKYLLPNAKFCCYGPFNKNGSYTSESNARFDDWLKQRNPLSAIRHLEDLISLAEINRLKLIEEITMPANNLCLVFQKISN